MHCANLIDGFHQAIYMIAWLSINQLPYNRTSFWLIVTSKRLMCCNIILFSQIKKMVRVYPYYF